METPKVERKDSETRIHFFTLDDRVESVVRDEIERTFGQKAAPEIKDTAGDLLYACVKELMVNASKSNIKRTFLIETKISEDQPEAYDSARKNVRKLLREHALPYLREKLKKHGYGVEVSLEDRGKGVVLCVKNPIPLLKEEETQIRTILKQACESDDLDLAMIYQDNADCREGAGLGLLLIVQLLKEMGVNPALFRIGVVKNETLARIEIPLEKGYVGLRG